MKYTNEGRLGASRAAALNKTEREVDNAPNSMPPPAQKVDPSVRLDDLKGEIMGNVPLATQMAKPQAYQAKKGAA
jgi:hypothetical protein